MLHHLVLFRWKPSATPAQIGQAITALRALPAHVPGIAYLAAGVALATGSNFDCGLVAHFASPADLDAYDQHPHHLSIIRNQIDPILEQLAFVDFTDTDVPTA